MTILKGIRLRELQFALAPLKLPKILTAAHQAPTELADISIKFLLLMEIPLPFIFGFRQEYYLVEFMSSITSEEVSRLKQMHEHQGHSA